MLDSLAAVSNDPATTRDAAAAWLDADAAQLRAAAGRLADPLSPEDPETITDALVDYAGGRDTSLLDPTTKAAHDAAYAIAATVLDR